MKNIHKDTDFKRGYDLGKENFLNHLLVAESCESISYGIATSHLILAAEEAVKAFLLLQLTIDRESIKNIKPEDFDSYFSRHRFKHEVIRQAEVFGTLMEISNDIRLKPFEGIEPETV
ncbi:MAG: hypothetical protein KDD29_03325 [Flavobacteriales bacterium]|nr:hypothetical protein [Flavobacteriales bacterium]